MKSITTLIIASAAAATFFASDSLAQQRRYAVRDLGPVPGAGFSYSPVITNNGFHAGWMSPVAGPRHAVLWWNGFLVKDIGAQQSRQLNSEAFGVNERGEVAFQAETNDADPNGEDFCGFTVLLGSSSSCPLCSGSDTPHVCRPFVWRNGGIDQLPMLVDENGMKGHNGAINQINNQGEVVGFAENATQDPDCAAPQVYEFRPVVWKHGHIQELDIPDGDREGAAFGINDKGQVVGGSGNCAAFSPTSQLYLNPIHALLWEHGSFTDLGGLPGQEGNMAGAINNRGQVIGTSGILGFLWTRAGGMQALNPLESDLVGLPIGINDAGEVVGGSLDPTFTTLTAAVWENGATTAADLNTFVIDNPAGLFLQLAEGINSRGEIVGFGAPSSNPNDIPHAFLAIPITRDGRFSHQGKGAVKPVPLSENSRKLLERRKRFGRFGMRQTRN